MSRPRLVSAVSLPAEYESLTFSRDVVERALLGLGWSDDSVARIVLASSEAVCNAIEHGSERGADVELQLWSDDAGVRVEVRDHGRNGSPTPQILPTEPPAAGESRGRGLMIMSRLSDEVAIGRNNGGGTRVVLEFASDEGASRAAEVA